jgi:eukaryotic-like serine/threonine-protein kinase
MASTTILDARAGLRDGSGPGGPSDEAQRHADASLPEIEGYRLLRRVGSGGMGVVYAAIARESGQQVALKVVRHEQHSPAAAERIRREIRALAAVRHPGIVKYVGDGFTADGMPYVAMTWLDGMDLERRLEDGALGVEDTLTLAIRVAGSLAAAHEHGVIHRDIKPANIFLVGGRPADACLLDFGVARFESHTWTLTSPGGIIGTPAYMAPEQARGDATLDRRADLFSLGCVLYECLCGAPAFAGEHVMAVLAKVLMESPPRVRTRVPTSPPALDELVHHLLEKDPLGRPGSAREVEQRLRALSLERSPASAPELDAITSEEQMFHSVLCVRGEPPGGTTSPDLARLAEEHGGRYVALVDGTGLIYMDRGEVASDRAAAAARCALALQAQAPWLAIALASDHGVVTGRSLVGRVLDRAAQLLLGGGPGSGSGGTGASASGRIRIDEVSTSLLDTAFEVGGDEHGLLLCAVHDVLPSARRLMGKEVPWVGRREELALLEARFDECAEHHHASAMVVIGEAGCGKSRLRHELDVRLRARASPPATVLIGRADPLRTQAPFSLMARTLAEAAGLQAGEPASVRQHKLRARLSRRFARSEAEVATLHLDEIVSAPSHEPVDLEEARQDSALRRERIEAAYCAWIRAECETGPVLLVLEDLHWADAATVQAVDSLLEALEGSPLLVLALARPAVRERFPNLWRIRDRKEIVLEPLSPRASRELVRGVLGSDIDDGTVERIVKGAGGNAFFLEELIRAFATGRGDDLPGSVLGMMQARLEALPVSARKVLRAASVFGLTTWRGGIRELLGPDVGTDELDAMLHELVKDEWLVPRERSQIPGQVELAFRHALVRDAAYATFTTHDERLGHRLAGQWLERTGVSEASVLAEHFLRGKEHGRAAWWLASAADQAYARHEYVVVLALAEQGLEHSGPGETRGRLLLHKAEALALSGHHREAAEAALAALAELSPGSPRWCSAAGEAAQASGRCNDEGRVHQVVDELMARIEPAGEGGAIHLLGFVRAAVPLAAAGQANAARTLLDEVIRVTSSLVVRDPDAEGPMCSARTLRAMMEGDYGTAYREMKTAAEAFERAGLVRAELEHRGGAGFCALELGDLEGGEALLRRTIERSKEVGHEHLGAVARHNLGRRIGEAGRFDEGLELEREALHSFERHGNRRMMGLTHCHLAWILLQAGRRAEAMQHVERALVQLREQPASRMIALATRAQLLLHDGQVERALVDARQAIEGLEALGRVQEGESLIRLTWAEALTAAGCEPEARTAILTAHERLLERAGSIEDPQLRASFLENVPESARVVALLARAHEGRPMRSPWFA